jgi:competence protein ComEC
VPLVLLSHLHADHVDGLPGVLEGRSVALVQSGPLDQPHDSAAAVERWTAAAGVPLELPTLGESRSVGDLRWTVLAPARRFAGTSSDPNNSSIVLRVEVGPTTVLLTGDVEPEAQRDLLRRGVDVRADVMKVPHHGSRHQEPAFLEAVGAAVVVATVGAENDYGHPSESVLDTLRAAGARSFRTDLDGDVALAHRDGRLVVVGRTVAVPRGSDDAPPRGLRTRRHAARPHCRDERRDQDHFTAQRSPPSSQGLGDRPADRSAACDGRRRRPA